MGLLSAEEQEQIVHAIQIAENKTSGEIRVAVEKHCNSSAMDRAAFYFNKLGMHKTALRNGVLIYLATEDHLFAIIGDEGINNRVMPDFWETTKEQMLLHFKKGDLASGVSDGIISAGKQLKTFFPVSKDDINELPDDVFFGTEK